MPNYTVTVATGTQWFAGTDDYIYLTLVGSEGCSERTLLDKPLYNDFERGAVDSYDITVGEDLGEIELVKIEKKKYWVHDDWYCKYITVKTPYGDYIEFPCFRWLVDDKEVVLRDGRARLPQHDKKAGVAKQHRHKELEQRQKTYRWKEWHPGFPMSIDAKAHSELPRDIQFDSEKGVDFVLNYSKAIENLYVNQFMHMFQSSWGDFADFERIFMRIKNTISEYVMEHWKEDFMFGYQFLNGCNPVVIRKCTEIPDKFPITQKLVEDSLERGLTLEEELKEGNLFIADYELMDGVTANATDPCTLQYLAAPICLLYKNSQNKIMPVAIQPQTKLQPDSTADTEPDDTSDQVLELATMPFPEGVHVEFEGIEGSPAHTPDTMDKLCLAYGNLLEEFESVPSGGVDPPRAFQSPAPSLYENPLSLPPSTEHRTPPRPSDPSAPSSPPRPVIPPAPPGSLVPPSPPWSGITLVLLKNSWLPAAPLPSIPSAPRAHPSLWLCRCLQSLRLHRGLPDPHLRLAPMSRQFHLGHSELWCHPGSVSPRLCLGLHRHCRNSHPYGLFGLSLFVYIPLQLHLGQTPGEDNPIFLPTDDEYDWMLAKIWVRSSDFHIHQTVTHLLRTHLISEVFGIAMFRQLPAVHPVFKLLLPHIRFTIAINTKAREQLICECGLFDKANGTGGGGHVELVQRSMKTFTYKSLIFPEAIKERGMDSKEELPYYFYRDDGCSVWEAVASFVADVVNIYYEKDETVQEDEEIQAFVKDVCSFGMQDFDQCEFPKSLQTKEQLVEYLTIVIFTASAQHAAVNFGQFDWCSWIPNSPPTMRKPPPTKKGEVDLKYIVESLPDRGRSCWHLGAVWALSQFQENELFLGMYPDEHFIEKPLKEAMAQFRKTLGEVTKVIKNRNEGKKLPYYYLSPDRIPNSVAV
ncbi:Arachidonate 5-lipoxygenase [Anabarilius grahami]|uniref:Arachidonate 5-lipoxygenase n=2 Tax=Cyprinoidei TaxID=30727 RepID=A0A3N0XY79_ANAGA|nr:Arachidonate 5-lipoxygenase [Anabarilius grahami]